MSQIAPMEMPQYQGPVGGGEPSDDAELAGIISAIGGAAGQVGGASYAAGQAKPSPSSSLPAQYNEPSQYPVTGSGGVTFPWAGNLGSAPQTSAVMAPPSRDVAITVPATDESITRQQLNRPPKTASGMSNADMAQLYGGTPPQQLPGTLGNLNTPPEMVPVGGSYGMTKDGKVNSGSHTYSNNNALYQSMGSTPTSPSGASAVQLPGILSLSQQKGPAPSAPTVDINKGMGSYANAAGLGGIGLSPGQEQEWLAGAVAGGVGSSLTSQGGLGRTALGGVGNLPLNMGGGLVGNLAPYALSYYARDKFA